MSDWDEDDGTNPQQILTWLEELKEKGVINEWRYKKMCDWMKDYHDLEETVRLARTPNEVHLLRMRLRDQEALSASHRWSQQLAERRLKAVQEELKALRAAQGK